MNRDCGLVEETETHTSSYTHLHTIAKHHWPDGIASGLVEPMRASDVTLAFAES